MRKKEPATSIEASCQIKVLNHLGLHARPAAEFVRAANAFRSDIWLVTQSGRFSALSLIEVMRANLECGAGARLEAVGVDAKEAVERLERVVREMRDYL